MMLNFLNTEIQGSSSYREGTEWPAPGLVDTRLS